MRVWPSYMSALVPLPCPRYRQKHAPMLSDFHPRSVEHVLRSGLISVLNDRSQDGCKVLVLQAARWDMDDLPMSQVLKALLLILDKLIEDQETQVHGFILFENLDGVGLLQMLRLARLEQEQQGETMELIQVSSGLENTATGCARMAQRQRDSYVCHLNLKAQVKMVYMYPGWKLV